MGSGHGWKEGRTIGASGVMQVRISDRLINELQVSCQRWMRSFSSLGAKIPYLDASIKPKLRLSCHVGYPWKFSDEF